MPKNSQVAVSSPVVGIKRATVCRSCGGKLTSVLDLGLQETISLGDKPSILAPLNLMKCDECHLVQLSHTADRDSLFRHYYFRSNSNDTYRTHLREVVDDIMKRANLKKGDVVVDIGANDGTMLSFYPDSVNKIGFEPSSLPRAYDYNKIEEYFTADALEQMMADYWPDEERKAKAIYAGFMFYDLEDPLSFLKDIKKVLTPDGLFVIEMNYLPFMLTNNGVDNICHEHLCYYTLRTLQSLLFRAGLEAEDVLFNDVNGGSFRVYIRHKSGMRLSKTVSEVLADEVFFESDAPYKMFAKRVKDQMHRLTAEIKLAVAKDHAIVDLVGASTRGLVIVQQAGLDRKLIRAVVERNPEKVGKTYAGIPIISEEQSKQSPADIYVILPYSFSKEIMERMPWGKKFIIPLPEVKVVESAKTR